jgi:hypothetical protein
LLTDFMLHMRTYFKKSIQREVSNKYNRNQLKKKECTRIAKKIFRRDLTTSYQNPHWRIQPIYHQRRTNFMLTNLTNSKLFKKPNHAP